MEEKTNEWRVLAIIFIISTIFFFLMYYSNLHRIGESNDERNKYMDDVKTCLNNNEKCLDNWKSCINSWWVIYSPNNYRNSGFNII